MAAAGYRDVAVLAGGIAAWQAAGFELFSGVNVPSKVFGEHVEHHFATPSVAPEELRAKIDAGEKLVILDSRPMDEYHKMNIPDRKSTRRTPVTNAHRVCRLLL